MSDAADKRKDVAFRKAVLKAFLRNIEQARDRFFEDCDRLESEHPDMTLVDKLRNAPKLQLDSIWADAMEVILDGLKRAIAGESDPFRLKGPRSGQVKFSDLDAFDMAVDAYRSWKKDGLSLEEACAQTAMRFSGESTVSEKTVRLALARWRHLGDRLLDASFCERQRELIDDLSRMDTAANRCSLIFSKKSRN